MKARLERPAVFPSPDAVVVAADAQNAVDERAHNSDLLRANHFGTGKAPVRSNALQVAPLPTG